MRLCLFCWCILALSIAGCCSHESASPGETNAKSADAECKTDDCCSSVSRSSLLTKSTGTEKTSDESK